MELENWRNGKVLRPEWPHFTQFVQVLDLSSTDGSEPIGTYSQAIFLDEFRVAVIPDKLAITYLAVFDTLIPQDHPGYMQRLAFPLEFCNEPAYICPDHDRHLGTPNKDEVLLPDPTQAILITNISAGRNHRILLVVRIPVLVKQVYSLRTDSCVPWDEWGRDAVAIEVQHDQGHRLLTFVHGAQVMIARESSLRRFRDYDVRTFDFSQRGRGSLPRGGADGTVRRVSFQDGVNLGFELDGRVDAWDELKSLSDGSLIHPVSRPTHYVGSEAVG